MFFLLFYCVNHRTTAPIYLVNWRELEPWVGNHLDLSVFKVDNTNSTSNTSYNKMLLMQWCIDINNLIGTFYFIYFKYIYCSWQYSWTVLNEGLLLVMEYFLILVLLLFLKWKIWTLLPPLLKVINFTEPLKPFIAITVEVIVLVVAIMFYERYQSKKNYTAGIQTAYRSSYVCVYCMLYFNLKSSALFSGKGMNDQTNTL